MGAGPLGSATLPVWAQPWYALRVRGVGPKFEPNTFGGVHCVGKTKRADTQVGVTAKRDSAVEFFYPLRQIY